MTLVVEVSIRKAFVSEDIFPLKANSSSEVISSAASS